MQRVRTKDDGLSPVFSSHQPVDRLFNFMSGTSFAAPIVANKAALLMRENPEASPNLVRVLLALGAEIPEETARAVGNPADQVRIAGYGRVDYRRAASSTINRVVLAAEDEVALDSFHVFELPVPPVLTQTRGRRRISVALAFYPPVRHSRQDYLGSRMSFRLVRGKSLEEVVDAYRRHAANEEDPETFSGTRFQCDLWPNTRSRDFSTLQKGELTFTNNPSADYGDTYYVVVRSQRIWAPEEVSHQRYAVGVALEHIAHPIDLYAALRARVAVRARV